MHSRDLGIVALVFSFATVTACVVDASTLDRRPGGAQTPTGGVPTEADFSVSITSLSPTTLPAGGFITYNVVVTNLGPHPDVVSVDITLDPVLDSAQWSCTITALNPLTNDECPDPATGTEADMTGMLVHLGPGSEATFVVDAHIAATGTGTFTTVASVSSEHDPMQENDISTSVETTIVPADDDDDCDCEGDHGHGNGHNGEGHDGNGNGPGPGHSNHDDDGDGDDDHHGNGHHDGDECDCDDGDDDHDGDDDEGDDDEGDDDEGDDDEGDDEDDDEDDDDDCDDDHDGDGDHEDDD